MYLVVHQLEKKARLHTVDKDKDKLGKDIGKGHPPLGNAVDGDSYPRNFGSIGLWSEKNEH
jgi:hypothetical protein